MKKINRSRQIKEAIAKRIADCISKKNIRKIELAYLTGKGASDITRWLSGECNYTVETLSLIEETLGIQIFADSLTRGSMQNNRKTRYKITISKVEDETADGKLHDPMNSVP